MIDAHSRALHLNSQCVNFSVENCRCKCQAIFVAQQFCNFRVRFAEFLRVSREINSAAGRRCNVPQRCIRFNESFFKLCLVHFFLCRELSLLCRLSDVTRKRDANNPYV